MRHTNASRTDARAQKAETVNAATEASLRRPVEGQNPSLLGYAYVEEPDTRCTVGNLMPRAIAATGSSTSATAGVCGCRPEAEPKANRIRSLGYAPVLGEPAEGCPSLAEYIRSWPSKYRDAPSRADRYDVMNMSRRTGRGVDDGRVHRFLETRWRKHRLSMTEGHAMMSICMATLR